MHAFDVLGDPVRRRVIELLGDGELSAGQVAATVMAEFGISQPAVSQHLRVLRESGFASVRPDGTRRLYALRPEPLQEVDAWLGGFRALLAAAPGRPRHRGRPREARAPDGRPDRHHDHDTDQRGAHP